MTKTLGSELSEELLWSTVEELRMANLLYDAKVPPFFQGGLSRRKMIRNAVALGMAAPVISAIAVPTAGATQSCLPSNATCSQSAPPACCPGLTCFFTEGGPTGFQCT
ncbi:MAG: hypothetical protein JO053_05840 [Acidobacteria bacterium]|nr:hypothetical protein [Acidobacteriota bacterium]